jgi:two-component system response regulator NreC
MKPIRVLIVDDHDMVRSGMRLLLDSEHDIKVVGEAGDGIEGLKMAKELRPDVAVLDVAMPRLGGLEMLGLLKVSLPQVKVVILSMYSKESFAHEALQAGAYAYVLKGAPSNDLLEAIRYANLGRYYFSKEVHSKLVESYVTSRQEKPVGTNGYHQLSDREKQVFRLLIDGNSTADVAELLCISIKTAEKHRTSINKKLGTSNPVEMMKYAIRTGLVDPDAWTS